jgi:hypothetical protein
MIVFGEGNQQMALAFTCDPKKLYLFSSECYAKMHRLIVNMGNIQSQDGKCKIKRHRTQNNKKSKPGNNSALYDKLLT